MHFSETESYISRKVLLFLYDMYKTVALFSHMFDMVSFEPLHCIRSPHWDFI
jgi:predicted transcriptional regulator with HTH domain